DEGRGAAADVPGSRTDLRRSRRAFPAGGAAVLPADARELLRGPGGRGGGAAPRARVVRPDAALLLAPARGSRARLRLRAGRRDASRGPGLEEPSLGLSRRPAAAPPRQRPPDAFAEGVRRGARDRLPGSRPEGEARDLDLDQGGVLRAGPQQLPGFLLRGRAPDRPGRPAGRPLAVLRPDKVARRRPGGGDGPLRRDARDLLLPPHAAPAAVLRPAGDLLHAFQPEGRN